MINFPRFYWASWWKHVKMKGYLLYKDRWPTCDTSPFKLAAQHFQSNNSIKQTRCSWGCSINNFVINSFTDWLGHRKRRGAEILRECPPLTMCHMSGVACHMEHVTCHIFLFIKWFVNKPLNIFKNIRLSFCFFQQIFSISAYIERLKNLSCVAEQQI